MTKLDSGKGLKRSLNIRGLFPVEHPEGTPVAIKIDSEGIYISRKGGRLSLFLSWEKAVKHSQVPGNAPGKCLGHPELLLAEPLKNKEK